MRAAAVLTLLGLFTAAAPAAAQFSNVQTAPDTWVSGWLGGYIDTGRVVDGASDSYWNFGSAFAGGLGVHRRLGPSLLIGLDASMAPAPYERTERVDNGAILDEGSAKLVSALATGRLRYGGGGSFSMYLTGGAGTLVYGMPGIGWDPDLALMSGAGLEYLASPRKALFIEWDRFWTFHQAEGIDENTAKHSKLRIGARMGF